MPRAFNARSGALVWSFDPVPDSAGHPAAPEWQLLQALNAGAGNAWGVMSVDEEHGLIMIPTGSASPDYYGGLRQGADRFADSLLVLEAGTGRVAWQQQLVHHDLWDHDPPAPPGLFDVRRNGRSIPALALTTKSGYVYLLNRETGGIVKALMPVHLFGQMADMDALMELARVYGLRVVEDAAPRSGDRALERRDPGARARAHRGEHRVHG